MKILHVIDQVSQPWSGGSGKAAFELARAQAKLGYDVTIYSTDYKAKKQEPPKGVRLVKYSCWLNLFGSIRIAPGLLFADYNFDIMHLHNYRTAVNLFAVLRRIPIVLQAHGSANTIIGLTKPLHDLLWNTMILKRAKRCIADADMEIGQYVTEGVDKNNIELIPVGVNTNNYRHIPIRKPKKQKALLFMGRFDRIKGVDLLIKAFSLLDDAEMVLWLAGIDYGFEAEIRDMVTDMELDSRVKYLGQLNRDDKLEVLTQADLFMMPSRYEMWGIAFMEALACGTPIIMTDTCEASKVLPTECGLVVPFNDRALADAIQQAFKDRLPDTYRDYRRKWVSRYSWDKIAKRTIKLYEDVLSDK